MLIPVTENIEQHEDIFFRCPYDIEKQHEFEIYNGDSDNLRGNMFTNYGPVTGWTKGAVITPPYTARQNIYGKLVRKFLMVKSIETNQDSIITPFAEKGDSGSPVFFLENEQDKAIVIGTVWMQTTQLENAVFIAPISAAKRYLESKFNHDMAVLNTAIISKELFQNQVCKRF